MAAPDDPAELQRLAQRYLDLWQQQVSALAADPEFAQALQRLAAAMGLGGVGGLGGGALGGGASAANQPWLAWQKAWQEAWQKAGSEAARSAAGGAPQGEAPQERTGSDGDGGKRGNGGSAARPASAAAPSADHGLDAQRLAERLAALEERIAALEAGAGGRGREPRKGARKRSS